MQHDDLCENANEEEATSMTNSCSRLTGFIHVKHENESSFRGSTPIYQIKKIDQETCLPTSTEADKIQDVIDQESLEKDLREGDESQPKLRRSNRIKQMMEDKMKE